MRSTATNVNSSGSPRGYADLKHEWKKVLLTPSQQIYICIYIFYDHYPMSDERVAVHKKIAFNVQHHGQGSASTHI